MKIENSIENLIKIKFLIFCPLRRGGAIIKLKLFVSVVGIVVVVVVVVGF